MYIIIIIIIIIIIVNFVKIGNKKIKRKHTILIFRWKIKKERKRNWIIVSEYEKTSFCWASEGPHKWLKKSTREGLPLNSKYIKMGD